MYFLLLGPRGKLRETDGQVNFFTFVSFFAHWSSRRGFVHSLVLLVKMKISQQPASIIAQSINPAKRSLIKNPRQIQTFSVVSLE